MDEQIERPKRWLAVLNALLAALGLGLAGWCVIAIFDAAFGGMRAPAYFILWVLAWIGVNRGFALWQQFTATGPARTTLRIAKWVLPFVLPVLVIHFVEASVQRRQLEIAARELAPVIAYADKQVPGGFIAIQAPAVPFNTPVHFQEGSNGYALWLRAPSIDLDGYTLSYDSRSRRWQRRHNDLPEAAPTADGRCILKNATWQCHDPNSGTRPRVVD